MLLLAFMSCIVVFGLKCDPGQSPTVIIEQLEGEWIEQEDPSLIQFVGSNYIISFQTDYTFQLKLERWTDVIDQDSDCNNSRKDYINGTYEIIGKQMRLLGLYSDASFSEPKPNCAGEEEYQFESILEFKNDTLYLMDATGDRIKLIRQS